MLQVFPPVELPCRLPPEGRREDLGSGKALRRGQGDHKPLSVVPEGQDARVLQGVKADPPPDEGGDFFNVGKPWGHSSVSSRHFDCCFTDSRYSFSRRFQSFSSGGLMPWSPETISRVICSASPGVSRM